MTTGGHTSRSLAEQATACELESFTVDQAVELGALATARAQADRLPIVIEVYHAGRLVFRAALAGSVPDSDDWIARKRRVVERFGLSTMAARVRHEEQGTDFHDATGLPTSEYAAHGGGFPIVVSNVGIVGAMYVSGLPQVEDHAFIVDCLTTLARGERR